MGITQIGACAKGMCNTEHALHTECGVFSLATSDLDKAEQPDLNSHHSEDLMFCLQLREKNKTLWFCTHSLDLHLMQKFAMAPAASC